MEWALNPIVDIQKEERTQRSPCPPRQRVLDAVTSQARSRIGAATSSWEGGLEQIIPQSPLRVPSLLTLDFGPLAP